MINLLKRSLEVKCFKCKNSFGVKYVVPQQAYSKKNNWEYWTNPEARNPDFWKDKKVREKDKQICNDCILKFYQNKELYWETIKDLKKRAKLRTYIHEGKFSN